MEVSVVTTYLRERRKCREDTERDTRETGVSPFAEKKIPEYTTLTRVDLLGLMRQVKFQVLKLMYTSPNHELRICRHHPTCHQGGVYYKYRVMDLGHDGIYRF